MESLKGVQNIVSVEDYKVLEKKNTIGWDIYIRMELLTPFNSYVCDRTMTEQEVIKLGCDICTALELCDRRKVIHRDIKPENIFLNDFGDFKLGDFGIVRKLENVTSGYSQKGTYSYMAPEIERGKAYNATVDIYSLGLVMYRLMNKNRLPFLDTEKQLLNPNERMAAIRRRINGEPLPPPCDALPALARIILCACAYEPGRRFASATAMKNALKNISANSSVKVVPKQEKKGEKEREKDSGKNKNKNRRGKGTMFKKIMITILLTILVAGGACAAVYFYVIPKYLEKGDNSTVSVTGDDVGGKTEKRKTSAGDDEGNVKSDIDEKVEEILKEAEEYAEEGNYEKSIGVIQEALKEYEGNEELEEALASYVSKYVEHGIKEVDVLVDQEKYDEAVDYLNDMKAVTGENETISEKMEEIMKKIPVTVQLSDLTPVNVNDRYGEAENCVDALGNSYIGDNTMEFTTYGEYYWGEHGYKKDYVAFAEYKLDSSYLKMTGTAAVSDQTKDEKVGARIEFLGDDRILAFYDVNRKTEPIELNLDLTGVDILKINLVYRSDEGGGDVSVLLADGLLTKLEEKKVKERDESVMCLSDMKITNERNISAITDHIRDDLLGHL